MTGKQAKVDPEEKERLRKKRLQERFQFESGREGKYERIYPSVNDEEKNQKYEIFIKKANEIWDEFTTGKGKKKKSLPYTSARLRTMNKGDWKYGKIEVKARIPDGTGTWPAIWIPTIKNGMVVK